MRSFLKNQGRLKAYIFIILFLILAALALQSFLPKESRSGESLKKDDFTVLLNNGEKVSLVLEIADTLEKRNIGLMNRKDLEDGLDGMIFVFSDDVQSGFWMKDTYIPLSIAFINKEGIIQEIMRMEPLLVEDETGSPLLYFPKDTYRFALEVKQGFFVENNIKIGDRLLGLQR